ncbi:MAG: UDP-N-acetylglucosamine--N-acetylmuramyl-(pentapeptide) pyrophosphoryl-undecaprenol N-acetylglucosamine transferase [Victivallales bacterium]|nr:UDP-N-acetylglucosamine--N-acetylmuramyl-(pentapeptide) pyrophosphoryl-undecaprenol N-acetylglucosamine transferase [Victivallales bacterium]
MNSEPIFNPALSSLVVFCGGTGGHFYPGLSVARAFIEMGGAAELCLGGKRALGQSELAASHSVPCRIVGGIVPPGGLAGRLKFCVYLLPRVMELRACLRERKPDFVLGMGSYTSIPAVLAARSLGIRVFLHDGNSCIGRANIFLSRFAEGIGLAFPAVNADKLKCPHVITGMPLRPETSPEHVREKYGDDAKAAAAKVFGMDFSSGSPLVLVFGGSQGAAVFNERVPEALTLLGDRDYQIVHISGKGGVDKVSEKYAGLAVQHLIIEGTEEMGLLYAASDLVVCRAGGSTVAELALFGKCAILIPYPHASDDHQRINAEHYTSLGASVVIGENDCSPERLADAISGFLDNRDQLAAEALDAKALSHPDAACAVLRMILFRIRVGM